MDFFLKKLGSWEEIFAKIFIVCLQFCQNRREMGLKMQNFLENARK